MVIFTTNHYPAGLLETREATAHNGCGEYLKTKPRKEAKTMEKRQTFVIYLKDEAENMVTFERFNCVKAETAKRQLLEVFTRSSLYRVSVKPATRAEVYATPDGYNPDPAPVLVFDLKENEQKPNKAEFLNAYIYAYGTTKKEAEKTYKEASADYIKAIIEGYHQDTRKAFYND